MPRKPQLHEQRRAHGRQHAGNEWIEATRIIHRELPDVRVIGLSMFQKGEQAAAMRGAGAVDYVTKSGSSEAMLSLIRSCCLK